MSTKEFNGNLPSNHEVVIGIDQSLTGFAIAAVSVELPTRHITWVYKSPYKGTQRLVDIQRFIQETFTWLKKNKNDIKEIAMEGTVLASHSALVLGELAATVKLFLWALKIRPLQIPPMTLKKYTTGKGNAKKQEMLLHIYKHWGIEFDNDNAADAYSLGRLARDVYIGTEGELFEKIKDGAYRDLVE